MTFDRQKNVCASATDLDRSPFLRGRNLYAFAAAARESPAFFRGEANGASARRRHRLTALRGAVCAIPANHARNRARRAFTLIEVLIAVATFAIVLAAINTVFYGALRLRNKTTQSVEASLPIQQTVAIIKRDLAGIVPPGGVLAGALKSGAGTSANGVGNLVVGGAGGMDEQGGPEIYTNTGTVDERAPWGDVQKVTYFLRDPTNRVAAAGKDLIRAVTRNLLPTIEEEPEEQWLMGGVQRIDFLFYTGTEWQDSWDATTGQSGLPKAIKVQIQLAPEDSRRTTQTTQPPIELVMPVVVQARTNQAQNAGGQP